MHRFSPRPNRADQVHWREWGEAAFAEARAEGKPLALFITAFWCGFCQRMDETSLSNDEVIALLNAFFIPVRVEESQRPDVDLRYNQDGWPSIVFLAPGGGHLLSVNYTPPEEFLGLLVRIVDYCQTNAAALQELTAEAPAATAQDAPAAPAPLTAAVVEEIAGILEGLADPEYGGFGVELKMLHTEATEFLLYRYETTGERWCLDHALLTLARLRASPTFDGRDGGFFRYSSKRDWREPHPEKLLADQAALLRNYLHAYLLSEDAACRDTAAGLVAYLEATLSDPAVAPFFLGCQDYVRTEADGELGSYLDGYVYCDANAHAASALLDAWWLLGNAEYRERALAVVEALWQRLRAPDGGMYHYWDGAPHADGLLGDAVATGLACLDAYAVTADATQIKRAGALADHVVARHANPDGGFFDISDAGPANLRFPLTPLTQNAAAASLFLRLADLGDLTDYRRWAEWALRPFPPAHRQHGGFAAGFGGALARLLTPPLTLTVSGPPGADATLALERATRLRLGHANVAGRYRAADQPASVELRLGDRTLGPVTDAASLAPASIAALR